MNNALALYRASLTPEQKAEALAQAQAKRLSNLAALKAASHTLKLEYLDSNHWASLASKYKVRMPMQFEPVSVKVIRKYLKKLDIDVETWNDSYTGMKYFVENNPKWSAYAVAGLILELKDNS